VVNVAAVDNGKQIGSALDLAPLDLSVITGCHINYIYSVSKYSGLLYVHNLPVILSLNQSTSV